MALNIISTYTQDQAIEDGFLVKLSKNIILTAGVYALKGRGFEDVNDDYMFESSLVGRVHAQWKLMPEVCTDGGNDRDFFSITFRDTKMFVVRNETGGYTVMLPEEY